MSRELTDEEMRMGAGILLMKLFFICLVCVGLLLMGTIGYNLRLETGSATCWEYRNICSNCFSMNTSKVSERIVTCGLSELNKGASE